MHAKPTAELQARLHLLRDDHIPRTNNSLQSTEIDLEAHQRTVDRLQTLAEEMRVAPTAQVGSSEVATRVEADIERLRERISTSGEQTGDQLVASQLSELRLCIRQGNLNVVSSEKRFLREQVAARQRSIDSYQRRLSDFGAECRTIRAELDDRGAPADDVACKHAFDSGAYPSW